MQSITNDNFGPLIAYLVPGATVLYGFSQFSPTLQTWFAVTPADAPTIGGFLYLTVASLAAGMTVSALRWAIVDTLHGWTGIPLPNFNFSTLGKNVDALVLLIEIHYRHYLWYSNMTVAMAFVYICYRVKLGTLFPFGWSDTAFVLLEVIFIATSRDTLKKYYARAEAALGTTRGHRHRKSPVRVNSASDPLATP